MALREQLFRTVFATLDATGANRALAPLSRGLGAILTLHHVRPAAHGDFAPNRHLEVEPGFLDMALTRARALGFEFVTLGEALRRLGEGRSDKPFLHLTFDDAYRDVRDFALPILRRHNAPATFYVASGFADGEGELWWLALEAAIARADRIEARLPGGARGFDCRTAAGKRAAWRAILPALRSGPEEALRSEIRRLAEAQGVDVMSFGRELCMDWSELAEFARDPLVEIGAHTVTHPMLAMHPEAAARAEMEGSRQAIELRLGAQPAHLAYPVGDLAAAGPRDYALAAKLGFQSAVTTRPGHLSAAHAGATHSLPRVSLNGIFQTRAAVDALLSGVPFAAMGLAKRLAGRS